MILERYESIKEHYKMAKGEGASLHYTMVGDCLDEIERLESALRGLYNDCRNEPCDKQRGEAMDEARKALEE